MGTSSPDEVPALTIGAARRAGIECLSRISPSPALDVDILLTEVLSCDRAYLLSHFDQPLREAERVRWAALLDRAAQGEPIAYILGRRAFYDLEFEVNPSVLIPRPETELLLEEALRWSAQHHPTTAADIGTGSGALAVTFARHVPQTTIYAVDASETALETARHNAERAGVRERLIFLQGDLLVPLTERRITLDLLMANLPYIPTVELASLAVSRWEPRLALDGGADGLEAIRRLLAQVRQAVRRGGLILLEIGADQGTAVSEAAHTLAAPQQVDILQDYAGHDRIVRIVL